MSKSWSLLSSILDSGQRLRGEDGNDNPTGSVHFQIPTVDK